MSWWKGRSEINDGKFLRIEVEIWNKMFRKSVLPLTFGRRFAKLPYKKL